MNDESAARPEPVRASRFGLSGKLLLLTISFVMIAEVLIYVPSVATFRVNWLRDHLEVAKTAALGLQIDKGNGRSHGNSNARVPRHLERPSVRGDKHNVAKCVRRRRLPRAS